MPPAEAGARLKPAQSELLKKWIVAVWLGLTVGCA